MAASALLGGCAAPPRAVVTLVFDKPYPEDDSPQVVVETLEPAGEWELDLELLTFSPTMRDPRWREVTRVDVGPDGTYDVPLPKGPGRVLLRADGDFVGYGEQQIELSPETDAAQERQLDLAVRVGAHVTLELEFNGIVTEEELVELEGRVLRFYATGPSNSGSSSTGFPHTLAPRLDHGGRAEIGSLIAYHWRAESGEWVPIDESLPPLRIRSGFSFEPEVGERVVVKVPIVR